MKPTDDQLGELLALKRAERPEEGYWQDFLCEFHHRQREQAVRKPKLAVAWGRAMDWVTSQNTTRWIYGAGVAYAVATVAFFLTPREADVESAPVSPVVYPVTPAPAAVKQLEQLDLDPAAPGHAGEQAF